MNVLSIFFIRLKKIIKNNSGTTKLLLVIILFIVLRDPINTFIIKYFSSLNIIYFAIIYFFLALLLLPTLPMTLIASSLYSPLISSIYIAITITFVAYIQIKFPEFFGLGIRNDKYISFLVNNMRLKTPLDKFYFFFVARNMLIIPLPVTSALAMKILNPSCKINRFVYLIANFVGTLTITFCVIKVVRI